MLVVLRKRRFFDILGKRKRVGEKRKEEEFRVLQRELRRDSGFTEASFRAWSGDRLRRGASKKGHTVDA